MQDRLSPRSLLGATGAAASSASGWAFGTASLCPRQYAAHDRRTAALGDTAHLLEKST